MKGIIPLIIDGGDVGIGIESQINKKLSGKASKIVNSLISAIFKTQCEIDEVSINGPEVGWIRIVVIVIRFMNNHHIRGGCAARSERIDSKLSRNVLRDTLLTHNRVHENQFLRQRT